MKVLVISHNVFSMADNMGKTLTSYFKDFKKDDLAQFYIHSEIPTVNVCDNYYRVTDKEMIKSVFGIKTGKIFTETDIETNKIGSRTDSGYETKLYIKARKRTPSVYLARNLWWKLGHWYNRQFRTWLDSIAPDCVFFASGDYAFMYDIALKIARSRNIPLYISCMDDYYFSNKNSGKFLGEFQHTRFMKSVKRCISYSTALFCICDSMSCDYAEYFNKKCITIHTAASFDESISNGENRQISYIGNLRYDRYLQLVDIGRALKKLGLKIDHIDVYSTETGEEILKYLTPENGIVFHGSISADEVKSVMSKSLALIHTESFDENIRRAVKYSVSTKIADSLMSGCCVFAYGPEEIASIKYLSDNKAAVCVTSPNELEKGLRMLFDEHKIREEIQFNARLLAEKNHSPRCAFNTLSSGFNVVR